MDAKEVIEKILSEAREQADSIIAEAQDKAAAQRTAFLRKLDEFNSETQKLAADAAEDKRQRILASARMHASKSVLAAKRQCLDDAFSRAAAKVRSLGDEEYCDLMCGMVKKSVETGSEQLMVGANDNRLDQKFVKNVNRELGAGFKGNISLADDRADIDGGFLLKRGKVTINASIDVLVNMARMSLETELAGELFAE